MDSTVFLTVLSGVITYVAGQLVLKLLIEPVQEAKKTIGQISHSLIEHAVVIHNPGVPSEETMRQTSQHLRKLSSQLNAHLYLVPAYKWTAKVFRLPTQAQLLAAAGGLMGLSNSVYRTSESVYKHNTKRVETICDSLSIYLPEGDRWPKEEP
jgi:hypothetical protein